VTVGQVTTTEDAMILGRTETMIDLVIDHAMTTTGNIRGIRGKDREIRPPEHMYRGIDPCQLSRTTVEDGLLHRRARHGTPILRVLT
jgi:hypothetical protein